MPLHHTAGSLPLYILPEAGGLKPLMEEVMVLQDQWDPEIPGFLNDFRRMTVILPGQVHSVGIINYTPPESFAALEEIIFRTVRDNRAEGVMPWVDNEASAKDQAMKYFENAVAAAEEVSGNSTKFIDAVDNYAVALHFFRLFAEIDRPLEYDEAVEGAEAMDKLRQRRIIELENEVEIQASMRNADKLLAALQELRYLYPADSPEQRKIREQISKLNGMGNANGGRR